VKPAQLSPLAQVEWTLSDLQRPARLFKELFGALPIEETFSEALAGPHMEIVHIGLWQTVLQLCLPLIDATGHWHALKPSGPHVYNMTYFLDDLSAVLERCEAEGLALEWHFPLGEIYKRVIAEDKLAGSRRTSLPDRGERAGPLELINVATPDLTTPLSALSAVFGDAVQTRMAIAENEEARVSEAGVELGRVRIHCMQALEGDDGGPIANDRPAVHSLAIPVTDLPAVVSAAAAFGRHVEDCPSYLFERGDPRAGQC
jgi:hypothetical protein